MSAFLGPIHYWLYQKIKLVNDREELLYNKAYETFGEIAEELRTGIWETYGSPPSGNVLTDLIDLNNIHGWLQRQVTLAEVREAALVRDLVDHCGEDAFNLTVKVFELQAAASGTDACKQGKYDAESAVGIYTALNDIRLNGMPCDQPDTVLENTIAKVVWKSGPRLQKSSWEKAGVDFAVMNILYQSWLEAFVSGMNPSFVCQQVLEISKGDAVNQWSIAQR